MHTCKHTPSHPTSNIPPTHSHSHSHTSRAATSHQPQAQAKHLQLQSPALLAFTQAPSLLALPRFAAMAATLEDVMDQVPFAAFFHFVWPQDAEALARTCSMHMKVVEEAYATLGRKAVLPGGCWSHKMTGRPASTVRASHRNYMPLALSSLITKTCALCEKKSAAGVTKWGFIACTDCKDELRAMLLNTYYVPKMTSLTKEDIASLPKQNLDGWRPGSKEEYTYNVVFRYPYRLVPRHWSLFHAATVVHKAMYDRFNEPKRRARKEAEKRAKEKRKQEEIKRRAEAAREAQRQQAFKDALAERRAALEAHPRKALVHKVQLGAGRILGDYLQGQVLVPKTDLAQVVARAEKGRDLLQVLHPDDIVSLDADPQAVAREKVVLHLAGMKADVVTKVEAQMERERHEAIRQAVATRRTALQAHPRKAFVYNIYEVMRGRGIVGPGGKVFYPHDKRTLLGDFLDPVVRSTTTLEQVVTAAERYQDLLNQGLHPHDITSPTSTAPALARRAVSGWLEEKVAIMCKPKSPPVAPRPPVSLTCKVPGQCGRSHCTSTPAQACPFGLCGNCCTGNGCARHSYKRLKR